MLAFRTITFHHVGKGLEIGLKNHAEVAMVFEDKISDFERFKNRGAYN
jgi:hypothetical protein